MSDPRRKEMTTRYQISDPGLEKMSKEENGI